MSIVTGASVETMEDTGESVTIELGGATRAHRWLIDRMSLVEIADAEALRWVAIMMIWRVTYFPVIEHSREPVSGSSCRVKVGRPHAAAATELVVERDGGRCPP